MKKAKRLLFLLGFSIAFNNVGVAGISIGMVFSMFYIFSQLRHFNDVKKIMLTYGFFIYLPLMAFLVMLTNNIIYPGTSKDVIFVTTYILDYFLFFILLLNGIRDKECGKEVFYGFSIGATIMAICYQLGIGVSVLNAMDGDRYSVFGMNENVLGLLETFAFIYTLNTYILKSERQNLIKRFFYIFCVILQVSMILSTASRTAFLITGISFAFSILLTNYSKRKKIIVVSVGLVAFAGGIYYLIQNSDLLVITRLLAGSDDGTMSGRSSIWEDLTPHIYDNLILGMGETGYNTLSRSLFGAYKSPHNEVLFLMLCVGIVGTFLMVLFWFITFKRGIIKYKVTKDPVAILLFVPLLFAILSQQILYEKIGWVAYAYMIIGTGRQFMVAMASKIKKSN